MIIQKNTLFKLILKAAETGAEELEIEYKDGYEDIIALKNGMGFGIERLKFNTNAAKDLFKNIHELKNRKKINISGEEYKIQILIYDSFGENAYKIKFQKL